jgi:hypothetical protein
MHRTGTVFFVLSLALAGACSDDDKPQKDAGADVGAADVGAADQGADGPAADGPEGDAGETPPVVPAGTGIAVISSDYQSISLSLLDPKTLAVTKDDCVNSGTTSPKLTKAFSGDVVLPSQPQGGKVVLIDRKNNTLTWVDPKTCDVERQINVSTGFNANPHDVVTVGGRLYVTRYELNKKPTAAADDYDEGSDVLIVDAATGKVEGRIDMTPHTTKAAGTVLPRPDRAVLVDDRIYVSLNNIGPSFAEDEMGHGRVVVIDPAQKKVVETLDLGSLKNCGIVDVSLEPAGLIVPCNGNFAVKDNTQIQSSGVAWFPLRASSPAETTLAGSKFGRPVSFENLASMSHDAAYVVVPGAFGGSPNDEVQAFDLTPSKAPSKFYEGSAGFVLGGLLVDRDKKQLFVAHADAAKPRVHVFDLAQPLSPKAKKEVDVSAATGLPPRSLSWY